MQSIKFTAVALSIIVASSLGSVAVGQETKTNFNKDASPRVQKNLENVKTPQDQTTTQYCPGWPRISC